MLIKIVYLVKVEELLPLVLLINRIALAADKAGILVPPYVLKKNK